MRLLSQHWLLQCNYQEMILLLLQNTESRLKKNDYDYLLNVYFTVSQLSNWPLKSDNAPKLVRQRFVITYYYY